MALVWKDRTKETSTTTGTGTYTLAGAVTGFQSFSAIGNTNTCYYAAFDSVTGDWEVGLGTYTSSGTTLARTSVLASSNAGSAVSWAAGTRQIWCDLPASIAALMARTDQANTFAGTQTFSALIDASGASAGQIAFPASQNASAGANTLDDYEEGTFTPALSASGSTFSYASRSGAYTKVGNLVTVKIAITLNTSGNTLSANPLQITSLPFASSAAGFTMPVVWTNAGSNFTQLTAIFTGASSSMVLAGATAASSSLSSALNSSTILSATLGSVLQFSGSYTV